MKKIAKNLLIVFLTFVFALAPISPLNFVAHSQIIDADGYEHINDYQEWTTDRIITAPTFIDEGGTLVIGKGVAITFDGGTLDVAGNLFVRGTVKENVIFKKSENVLGYSIAVGSTGKMIMRNVDFSGGGNAGGGMMMRNNPIINTAYAYGGGLVVDGGYLEAQGCNFHDNDSAITVYGSSPDKIKVRLSKFENNNLDVYYNDYNNSQADFQYNWWGDSAGPQRTCDYYGYCYYNKLDGYIDFSKWLTKRDFHDPVIIIPGIFGSAEENGQLQLDPVFHTYDNLYAEFANNGYVIDKDLFVFPYEWRDSNVENAKKLKNKIAEIRSVTNWPVVDVVAHSMGGLLAREYIEADYYANDVDQLITLATPNLGAPEAYMKWEGDGWFLSPVDIYMSHVVKQEAEENGFADAFDYMHNRPIASLQELLPVYSYLYEADNNGNLRTYPDNYPRNEFLENLNANSSKLSLVEYDKIVGNIAGNNTVGGINVVNADMGKYWMHGYPLGFEVFVGDRGIILTNGDRTVPLDSAKSVDIKSDSLIELPTDHRNIVTDAQKDVLELLTGMRPTTEVNRGLIKNIFLAQVFSPIDIQIVAPDGKRVGKDFATGNIINEIDGAYYTGYNTKSEFVTIPNPIKGEYKILTEGTGDGAYKIETTEIDQNSDGVTASAASVIEGVAVVGQQEEKVVEIKGVEFNTETNDVTAPEVKIIFNTQTNSMRVEGVDENPTTVTYVTSAISKKNQKHDDRKKEKENENERYAGKLTTATVTDQAGNVTILKYTERFVNHDRRVAVELNSISYNGVVTKLHDTMAKYNWSLNRKDATYSMFATHLRTASSTIESHYRSKQNVTMIMTRPQELDDDRDDDNDADRRAIRQKLAGLVVPALVTRQGVVEIKY